MDACACCRKRPFCTSHSHAIIYSRRPKITAWHHVLSLCISFFFWLGFVFILLSDFFFFLELPPPPPPPPPPTYLQMDELFADGRSLVRLVHHSTGRQRTSHHDPTGHYYAILLFLSSCSFPRLQRIIITSCINALMQ